MVLTTAGNKAIEEIKAGDLVYSTDPETGESEYKEVVQTFENETEELIHISVADDEIVTTPKHPFYVPHKGWTSAIDLRAGDILVLSNGEYVIVEKVQHEILESPIKVYNFEVRDFHTYYVGENSVLVHNKCHDSEPFEVVKYGDKTKDIENHHGVLDVWAKNNIDGYKSRAYSSTAIALTPEQHTATKEVYREWLFDLTGKKVGGSVDWKNVSSREIFSLSEKMFDAAGVPNSARYNYYSEFNRYIYGLI